MHFLLHTATLMAFFASITVANGNLNVRNACSFNVYGKLADSSSANSNPRTLKSGETYSEPQDLTSGREIKVTRDTSAGSPILQLDYIVSGGRIFYDFSLVNGNPFSSNEFSLTPSDKTCPASSCVRDKCQGQNEGATASCNDATNLTLRLC